ncbi:GatB/YqeY domain-containing protein [Suilimivivens sp.]|uniref:GatB/YqeY domain-containing protein n=1 Tax=Suilimivivens sp. TaxID=2981669 RepID=UPI00307A2E6C
MSMADKVRSEMVAAMKNKEKDRKDALSMLLSALKNKAIDKREDLTEAEEFEVVKKEIKQTKETMELAPADREDIKEACEKRLAVYQEFAPEEMSKEAVLAEVKAVLAALAIDAPSMKDKGKVMKELMPRVKGRADGGMVNKIVGEVLNGEK